MMLKLEAVGIATLFCFALRDGVVDYLARQDELTEIKSVGTVEVELGEKQSRCRGLCPRG